MVLLCRIAIKRSKNGRIECYEGRHSQPKKLAFVMASGTNLWSRFP